MLKLGKFWEVPGTVAGKKRPPAEVAEAVEANVLKRATRILMGIDANHSAGVLAIEQ